MSFPTTAFPVKSSQTKTSTLYQNSQQNSVTSSTSIRTSVWHITLKPMEQAKEPIKPWSNTSKYSAELNKTTGTHSYHLHSTPKTHGHLQLPRKYHTIYSSDTHPKYTNQPEKPPFPPSNNDSHPSKKPGKPPKRPNVKRKNPG